jgi:hypothetical protein
LNDESRYPLGYLTYGPGDIINFRPGTDPNVVCRDGLLQITGPAKAHKFAMDLSEGWLAYLTADSRLLIKKFPVYNSRIYGELAGNNMSFWYNGQQMCEIEPIGPLEILEPGEDASFTETWYAVEFEYPGNTAVDAGKIRKIINMLAL